LKHDDWIKPVDTGGHVINLSAQLLRTCKAIREEASQTLYAQNRFDFTNLDITVRWLGQFKHEQSSDDNASLIRNVRIACPQLGKMEETDFIKDELELGNIALSPTEDQQLNEVGERCPNLRTLTIDINSLSYTEHRLRSVESSEIADKALELVTKRLMNTLAESHRVPVRRCAGKIWCLPLSSSTNLFHPRQRCRIIGCLSVSARNADVWEKMLHLGWTLCLYGPKDVEPKGGAEDGEGVGEEDAGEDNGEESSENEGINMEDAENEDVEMEGVEMEDVEDVEIGDEG
jgi:hypothetical protein